MAGSLCLLLPGLVAWAQSAGGWQPGPNASGDTSLTGFVDTPAPGASVPANRIVRMRGWVADPTAQGSSGVDDVRVYLGSMDSGTLLGEATPTDPRPDVAAASGNPAWSNVGWSMPLDTGVLGAGANLLSVYAHTPARGWWFTQLSLSVAGAAAGPAVAGPVLTVTAPAVDQTISTHLGQFVITGSVTDPAGSPRTVDWVEVWLNGEQNTSDATILGDAELSPDGSWSLAFNPSVYPPLAYNLYIYAHSDVSLKTSLQVVHIFLSRRP